MLPVAFALAGDEGEEAGKAISIVMGGLTTGIVVGPGFGALVTNMWSWREAFIALGLSAFAIAFVAPAALRRGNVLPPEDKFATLGRTGGDRILVPGAIGALCGMFFGIGGAVGIYSLVGERLRDALQFDTLQVGLVYIGFGLLSVLGNVLAAGTMKRMGSGRAAMRLSICVVALCIVVIFAQRSPSLLLVSVALGAWALFGGIGAPGLQTHIAGLSASRIGVLMALGASALNFGVALSATVAGEAYLHSAQCVAALGAAFIGIAVVALVRP